jgi:F-type H+-transporting ATPase subunit b
VKSLLRRRVLAGLALAVVLGFGSTGRHIWAQTATASAEAQAGAGASTPDASLPDKSKQEQNEDDQYLKSPHVVALGKMLGLNPEQSAMAFTVGNFILLAVGVVWLILKILPKALRDRNTTIQKNLADALTVTEEARARLSGVEERLSKLDSEIAAMRDHAEQEAAHAELRIKAAVEDEKGKIVVAAEQEIAAATSHAQKLLQQYAAEMAIDQAARKLVVSAETDRLLVKDFASRLTGDDSKKGQN